MALIWWSWSRSSFVSLNYFTILNLIEFISGLLSLLSLACSCLFLICSCGVRSGVMNTLVIWVECSFLRKFNLFWRILIFSSLVDNVTFMSLGLSVCLSICLTLLMWELTPMYLLIKDVTFCVSLFFQILASVDVDSGKLCTIKFSFRLSCSFPSDIIAAVVDAINSTVTCLFWITCSDGYVFYYHRSIRLLFPVTI